MYFVKYRNLVHTGAKILTVIVASATLSACSSTISRFDFPVFGLTGSSDNDPVATTASLQPVPSESVYNAPRDVSGGNVTSRQKSFDERVQTNSGSAIRSARLAPVQDNYKSPEYSAQPYQQRVVKSVSPPPVGTHVIVAPGDTLYNLAQRNNVSFEAIKQANNLSNNNIRIGQKLIIPGAVTGNDVSASLRTASPVTSRTAKTYIVGRGETLYSIARNQGVSYVALAETNNIDDASNIRVGQKLLLPTETRRAGKLKKVASVRYSNARNVDRAAMAKKVTRIAPVETTASTDKAVKRQSRPETKKRVASLPKAVSTGTGRFRWPVRGRIISQFGNRADGTHNDGINVAVPQGALVKAAENGVVAYAGSELKGYGNLVLIRHDNNWVSAYAHNESIMVKRGDKIVRGQVIAKVGRTGSVNQPQLHFELRKGSRPVNPLKYMSGT